jgi:two-component system, response regulator
MERSRSIMLVEDNPNDEFLTIKAFKEFNTKSEIIVARDGVEALDYLYNPGAEPGTYENILPRVVFLDLKLPRVDGLEVLKKIREHERTRLLPVIILTSSREEKDLVRCYSLGANSYVCKPVDFRQFMSSIKQLSTYWLEVNEYPELC